MTYPARCPGCGSPATDTLRSVPGVPIYLCGSFATMLVFPCYRPANIDGETNLQTVSSADMRDLLDLVDMASVAVMRAAG